jgi:hypothetical protein
VTCRSRSSPPCSRPRRSRRHRRPAGCLLLAGAYVALSTSLFAGEPPQALLVVLLGVDGLGLGTQVSALIAHLTGAVSARYAPGGGQVTSRRERRSRARRRRAKVTRMPSSETASVIFDSPAMRSLNTKGTSSMRLPIR